MINLIRYPGSKAKLYPYLSTAFPVEAQAALWSTRLECYCEPFFGSGAIGWNVLEFLANRNTWVIINDIDPGMAALWQALRDDSADLITKVRLFKPSAEAFFDFKKTAWKDIDPVEAGFRKLAIHQISFSGLGEMAGGPLGGKDQRSEYNVDCRWNAERLVQEIKKAAALMRNFHRFDILNLDFEDALARMPPSPSSFAYLDPPYYVQGPALYKHCFGEDDHVRLAETLHPARYRWVLSYDDHPRVRELYHWALLQSFNMTPTVQTSKGARRKNSEVVIRNFDESGSIITR